ncbi:TD and POZ domain-containing protein 4 [Araneus ventricosus]|uniref:TD and POZ domain-containing protein 4 n=1 Tax=Araneus ventricosus TaxID=182803 RepID=A0A4Y2RLP6_ARAVE|nr:TD and POZ domain-containing protein 4 [Araneus ventricosus]
MAATVSKDEERRAHFTYIWKIESAPRFELVSSPVFTVQSMEMTRWNLCMRIHSPSKLLALRIQRKEEDGGPESIEVEFELAFLDTDGFSLAKRSGTEHLRKEDYSRFAEISDTDALFDLRGDEFFPKDLLTVRCRLWRKGTEICKSELCFASTQFDVYRPSCVWAVKGCSSLQLGEKRIRILNSAEKRRPQLILTLSLAEADDKECVFIHLVAPHLRNYFHTDAEIAVLDAEGMVFLFKRVSTYMDMDKKITKLSVFEKSKLKALLLSDDVLLLRCELKLTSSPEVGSRIEDYKLMDYPNLKTIQREKSEAHFDELSEAAVCPFKEIVNLFKEDGTLSDVCLRAGTKSFPVHKLILSSRSPVFRAMFTKDMREKTSKCIDIPDLDADTLGRLLLYIYEDKIQELTWEAAANLFEAADKYEVLDLKEKCSRFLKSTLTESNVCKILLLADMHNDESLKKAVQEFILNNSEIIYSDVWKVFKEDHSKVALETAEHIIYNMKHSRS